MTDTVNLGLPCIEGSQAQKHVTHNDALRILDTLVQLAVLDRDLTTPPGSPSEGQRWIVKTGATGAWSGHVNAIAAWQDSAWQFSTPQSGWCAFVVDEGTLLLWNGTAWGDFFSTVTSIQNLAMLGVGTTADSTNRLSAKLNNTLFVAKTVAEGGDGNLRYKLSKESSSKTLSFLLQDNYSGRAEIGLTGDDDFHFKVSPDGTTWYEGIKIAAATGAVTFPNTTIAGGQLAGFRNLLINPHGRINQRAVAAAGLTNNTYGHDQWIGLTQSAGITPSTVSDAENGTPRMWRLSQANVTAQRMGYVQWIEGANCKYLRGKQVTLSGRINFSLNAAVRYAICEWTGTEDTPAGARDIVNSWTNATFTTGQFFKSATFNVLAVGSITPAAATLTDLTALTATVGNSANNLIVFIWTEGAAAQNATLAGALQLEQGAVATAREFLPYSTELTLCQRYCYVYKAQTGSAVAMILGGAVSTTLAAYSFCLPVQSRVPFTGLTVSAVAHFFCYDYIVGGPQNATAISLAAATLDVASLLVTVASGLTKGGFGSLNSQNASAQLIFTGAEI